MEPQRLVGPTELHSWSDVVDRQSQAQSTSDHPREHGLLDSHYLPGSVLCLGTGLASRRGFTENSGRL